MRLVKLALTVSLATIFALTAACSKQNEAGDQSQTNKTVVSQKPDKTYTVSYSRYWIKAFQPPAENVLEKMIEKDLNIKLTMDVAQGNYPQWLPKFNARVAAGDLPDLVMLDRADLVRFAGNGTIIPLSELLDKQIKLKSRLNADEWKLASVGDKIYGVPFLNPNGPYTALYIRKDWLDKLNLQMPTTTEELFHVLKAFTFNDPDGNNKNDTLGISAENANFSTLSSLTNAFGLPQFAGTTDGIPNDWIDSSGKLHFGPVSDEYKNYLQYMNKLYSEKVLDPDIASNTFATFQQKVIQGQVGVAAMFNPFQHMFQGNLMITNIKKANPNANWVYLPPVKGPDGQFGNNAQSPAASYALAVTRNALKEPGKSEKIIELLSYLFRDGLKSDKGGEMINFGVEGVDHQKENGKIVKVLPELTVHQNQYLDAYTMGGIPNSPDSIKVISTPEEYKVFEQINAQRSKGNKIVNYYYSSLPFAYDGDKYVKEMSLKYIYGKEDPGAWDNYVKTLNERYQYAKVQEIREKELKDLGLLK